MRISNELARKIGERHGVTNQRGECAGQPFLIEDEALAAWLERVGVQLADVDKDVVVAYRVGYGVGADRIQRLNRRSPAVQREAMAWWANYLSAAAQPANA